MSLSVRLGLFSVLVVSLAGCKDAGPNAEDILKKASDYYATKDAFEITVNKFVRIDVSGGEQPGQFETTYLYASPGKFRRTISLPTPDGVQKMHFASDGERTALVNETARTYRTVESPETITIWDEPQFRSRLDAMLPLLSDNIFETLTADATEIFLLQTTMLDDREAHQIRIQSGPDLAQDVWVATGETPTILQIDTEATVGVNGETLHVLSQDKILTWDFDIEPSEADFTFRKPAGFHNEIDLLNLLDPVREMPQPSLTGRDAPKFTIELLDGGKFSTADQIDKALVLLQFFSTQNDESVEAIAPFRKMLDGRAEQGIEFLPVAIGEQPNVIESALKEHDLEGLRVGRDPEGLLARTCLVADVPEIVVIDKSGVVQAVHREIKPDEMQATVDQIAKELDDLLAGKSLVEKDEDKKNESKEADASKEDDNQ